MLALDAAVDGGILHVDDQGALVFVHDLVREAAIGLVPPHRRAALHAAIADVLEDRGDPLGAVPHLLDGFAALEPGHVVDHVLTACEVLDRRGAYEDVLAIVTRLLGELERDDRATLVDIAHAHLAISTAHTAVGAVPAVKHHAGLAGAAALAAGDRQTLTEAAVARARYAVAGIIDPETLTLLDVALEHTGPDDTAALACLVAMRAHYLFHQEGDGARARASMTEALAAGARRQRPIGARRRGGQRGAPRHGALGCRAPGVPARGARRARIRGPAPGRHAGVVGREAPASGAARSNRVTARASRSTALDRRRSPSRWGRRGSTASTMCGPVSRGSSMATRRRRERAPVERCAAGEPDHNLLASWHGQLHAARRWDGTLPGDPSRIAQLAEQESGLPLTRSIGALSMAIVGAPDAAAGAPEPDRHGGRPLVDDSTLGAQCAALVEACTLSSLSVPSGVEQELLISQGSSSSCRGASTWSVPPTASSPSWPPAGATARKLGGASTRPPSWSGSCRSRSPCARRRGATSCSATSRRRMCRRRSRDCTPRSKPSAVCGG